MSHRRCCCNNSLPETCDYFVDEFDRSTIGSDWNEVSGSWFIDSGKLATSDSNAIIECVRECPNNELAIVVSSRIGTASRGDTGDIYIDGYRVRFDIRGEVLTLYDKDGITILDRNDYSRGGQWTELYGDVTSAEVKVCASQNSIRAHVVVASALSGTVRNYPEVFAEKTIETTVVRLGTGSVSGTVTFENIALLRHYQNNPTCPDCEIGCVWCSGSQKLGAFLAELDDVGSLSGAYILNLATDAAWPNSSAQEASCRFEYAFPSAKQCGDFSAVNLVLSFGNYTLYGGAGLITLFASSRSGSELISWRKQYQTAEYPVCSELNQLAIPLDSSFYWTCGTAKIARITHISP